MKGEIFLFKKYTLLVVVCLLLFSVLAIGCREEELEEEQIKETEELFQEDRLVEGFMEFKKILKDISSDQVQEELIDAFFSLIDEDEFPLRENGKVILIYRADDDVDEVEFASDLTLWKREDMASIDDSSLYYKKLKVDTDISFDYLFWVDDKDEIDKLNEATADTTYYQQVSNLEMSDYQAPDYWANEAEEQGELIEADSYKYYLPADYDDEQEYELLYFIGTGYLEAASIKNTLDDLNYSDELANHLAVFIDDAALEDEELSLLLTEIDEKLKEDYNLSTSAEDRYLISYGNYADELLNLAINHNDRYNNLLLQSPEIYSLPELEDNSYDLNLYLDWGKLTYSQDSVMNLDFVHLLKEKDYQYRALVHPTGNQWSNWRANIYYGLKYLLGVEESEAKMDQLVITDDFSTQYSNYFPAGGNDSCSARREDGVYELTFNDSKSIELDNYKFKNFELELNLIELEGSFGFTILGENDYTILKDTNEKKIYLSSLNGDLFEEVSFSDDFKLEKLEIVSEDNKIKFVINNILMSDLTIEQNSSKMIGFIGSSDTVVKIDNIKISEQLN